MKLGILAVLFILNDVVNGRRLMKRVIKGSDAPKDKFRWAISLKGDIHKERSVTVCGATLIHRQWLVSAAHCFLSSDGSTISNQTDPSLWHVRAGSKKIQTQYENEDNDKNIQKEGWHKEDDDNEDLLEDILKKMENDDNSFSNVKKRAKGEGHIHLHLERIILHPNYRSSEIEWDIALMKLKTPVESKYIGKSVEVIELPNESDAKSWPKNGQKCVLIGWGCKSHKGDVAEYGQLASLKVLTNKYCEKVYDQGADLNKDHEFCAGSVQTGHGVCEGDSGSGLACEKNSKWVLAGVASATHGENPANYPGLFTRVSYFIPWINSLIT